MGGDTSQHLASCSRTYPPLDPSRIPLLEPPCALPTYLIGQSFNACDHPGCFDWVMNYFASPPPTPAFSMDQSGET